MKARAIARRAALAVLAAVCVVVLLATAAVGYVRRNPTYSGVWQDWGDNVWEYYYFAPTDCEYWRFKTNQQVRFAYKCTPGQWWQYTATHGGFSPIGLGGVGNDFLGDDHNWHAVDTRPGHQWSFQYWADQDCAYWLDTAQNETRFAYKYGPGQWWDYTKPNNGSWTGWGHLGLGALTTAAFLGDGEWHTFSTANMPGGNYFGWTTDAQFKYDGTAYYWQTGIYMRYSFVYNNTTPGNYAGTWYLWNGTQWLDIGSLAQWQNVDCRYHGGGIFILGGLATDPGTNRPASVPSPQQIQYIAMNTFYPDATLLWQWTIYNPGSDNKWSGGLLNVLWCHNGDEKKGFAEYTKEDVVVFATDMAYCGFANMVNWMTLVRDYFRQQISTVMVAANGSSTGWYMGEWMDGSNYSSFQSDWIRWGNLMTADGQLISLHPQTGQASFMLTQIASLSGMDIFANTNPTQMSYSWITGSGINASVWNQNMQDVTWLDSASGRSFEYTTTGQQNYRWILYY